MKTLVSTGSAELDRTLGGIHPGDTILWQVAQVDHYIPFLPPFISAATQNGRETVYFRFADHPPLVGAGPGVRIVEIRPQAGFESFIDRILHTIQENPAPANYLFDNISPLAADWYSDQMVGNFFMIVCPYIHQTDGVAYFSILRNQHSHYALDPVAKTARILIDVYHHGGRAFLQPLKVEDRFGPRMFTLHEWGGGAVRPVSASHAAAEVLNASRQENLGLARHHLGIWSRTFVEAEAMLQRDREAPDTAEAAEAMRARILRMAVTRDQKMLELASRYFSLSDLVYLGSRMLGTGLVGGKAVDLLLARAILCRANPRWGGLLEMHDSFFIPSDVFYTYLVQNGCWESRRRQLHAEDCLDFAGEACQRILEGEFPPHFVKRFSDLLDYFGQSPLVVRSSSLLEDSFGNAFSGKYESVFCANQGSKAVRLAELTGAIKRVYASAMSRDALEYRMAHGLMESDEQMALVVQRVSGAHHGGSYFPHISAVAFSFNPYVWSPDIDPKAGMMRLVFGLGTRAVDRADGDHTRLVALNAPELRPDGRSDSVSSSTQQKVDVLDLSKNRVATVDFPQLAPELEDVPMGLFAAEDPLLVRYARERGISLSSAMRLNFGALLTKTDFVQNVRGMLRDLEKAYAHPVDVELAANFEPDGSHRIALLQCRPLHVKGMEDTVLPEARCGEGCLVMESGGPVVGRSRMAKIDRLVLVSPRAYGMLSVKDQYAVARVVGAINRGEAGLGADRCLVLAGPGRWGSSIPALGLPVSFAEINRASALCEILEMHDGLIPEVSLGTHFFNDLVELDMLYWAHSPRTEGHIFHAQLLDGLPNRLLDMPPELARWAEVVRVLDFPHDGAPGLMLWADTMKQKVLLYFGSA